MSIRVLAIVVLLAATGGSIAHAAATADVRVLLLQLTPLGEREMQAARAEADRLFATTGVRVAIDDPRDTREGGLDGIEVRVASCGQPGVPPCRPGVLGSTVKDGDGSRVRYIALYIDRIRAAARDGLTARATLLGRVLAHELVHALAGGDAHEARGLMAGRWTLADVDRDLDPRVALSPALRERVRRAAAGPPDRNGRGPPG